jgi:hypothetical protein
MKLLKSLFVSFAVLLAANTSVLAQEAIDDVDLKKYALLNEVITLMKKDISIELNKMIKAQEGMTGQRYKELAATKGDEAKLQEIGAKDFEIKFLELTTKLKEDRIEAIKTVNSELATKMVGNKGRTYKSIKAELKVNPELKARYNAIVATLRGETTDA